MPRKYVPKGPTLDLPAPERMQLPKGTPGRGSGRPTSYKPEFCLQALKLCNLGATDVELADFFDTGTAQIGRWRIRYPEFADACKTGKDALDERVEQALYHRAIGYSYDTVKILADGTKVPYREYCPPDTAAAFIWLKNRRRDTWRDRKEVEVGGPGDFDRMTDDELKTLIAERVARIGENGEGAGTEVLEGLPPRQLN